MATDDLALETRHFYITTEVPDEYSWDEVNRERVLIRPAHEVTETVAITVDWAWMAKQVGTAAIRNRGKMSTAMAKAIVAKSDGIPVSRLEMALNRRVR